MAFHLRTFGALELTTATGESVSGAAAQQRPLMILALAALTPDGISRERLLRALWPRTARDRARATLKQHLYGLRQATGVPDLLGGSPRLTISAQSLRVDALELLAHVEAGRLEPAARLLRGELLESVAAEAGACEELLEIVDEIRASFSPKVALVRAAERARQTVSALPGASSRPVHLVGASRALTAASRRFVQGITALPRLDAAQRHRAAWCTHDLLEALAESEHAGMPAEDVRAALQEPVSLWQRSDLIRGMCDVRPGEPHACEIAEWLSEGGVRSHDAVGRVLERQILESEVAGHGRTCAQWQGEMVLRAAWEKAGKPLRLLSVCPAGVRDLRLALPALRDNESQIVLCDEDPAGLALAAERLSVLAGRLTVISSDPFRAIRDLAGHERFDVILLGSLLHRIAPRLAAWLVAELLNLLAPRGRLHLVNPRLGHPWGPWLRCVTEWSWVERDMDDLHLLLADVPGSCTLQSALDPSGTSWLVTLTPSEPDGRRAAP